MQAILGLLSSFYSQIYSQTCYAASICSFLASSVLTPPRISSTLSAAILAKHTTSCTAYGSAVRARCGLLASTDLPARNLTDQAASCSVGTARCGDGCT